MRLHKELLVILYVFVFLVNDPQLVRAYSLQDRAKDALRDADSGSGLDLFMGLDSSEIHLIYELNGGINSNYNKTELKPEEFPMKLDVPLRTGYNFAGWYTDCNYTEKITEINQENADNMVLFAKWTKVIDNSYNVEMYSYQTDSVVSKKRREVEERAYPFRECLPPEKKII